MIEYAYGNWLYVGVLVAFMLVFLHNLLRPRTSSEWRNFGLTQAFFVALFTEMFGFPLTIYILSSVFGTALSFGHSEGHLFGVLIGKATNLGPGFGEAVVMAASTVVILLGTFLTAAGWRAVYRGNGALVTDGPYARVRHPQYLGLMIVVAGFLVQWPTLITLVMAPLLFGAYLRLAAREEAALHVRYGHVYQEYVRTVPRFLPHLSRRLRGERVLEKRLA